jgi:hypothetical protein
MSDQKKVSVLPAAMDAPAVDRHPDPRVRAMFDKMREERALRQAALPEIRAQGVEALKRLFKVANEGDSGQAGVIARFLLCLYNGYRFKFDLTDLRRLDGALHDDCLAVLRMDHTPLLEVHRYIENGQQEFERMARDWGLNPSV